MSVKSFFKPLATTSVFAAALYVTAASAQTRPRPTPTATPDATTTITQTPNATTASPSADSTRTRRAGANATRTQNAADEAAKKSVLAAFDALLEGIRRTNVRAVMNAYWNSPQLVLFNNNGTVTKTWKQVETNRTSSYPNLKDVTLEVRDVQVQMLGKEGAVLNCLWTQTQTVRDVSERATGRMTLVFRKNGTEWKIAHAHTSPDNPDPSRLLPSERPTTVPPPTASPANQRVTTPTSTP